MPTGYTAGVADGTVTEFDEYAMNCARAFGALIEMRDDPSDAKIPDQLMPSGYHLKRLKASEGEYRRVGAMSDAEADVAAREEYATALESHSASRDRQNAIKERYERMLQQSREFRSPSLDHDGYKEFLVSQLEESLKHDTGYNYDPPAEESGTEWRSRRLVQLDKDMGYHRKYHAEEIERTDGRNKWLTQLREALAKNKERP